MNSGCNKNVSFYKHSYWSSNAAGSGAQRDFSSTFRISNVSTHFNTPPAVQFSPQGAQVGRMVCGWKVNDKPCSSPPRISNGRPVIQICGGPELKCEFVPYREGPSIITVRNDISARLSRAGQAPTITQHVFADHERPEFMRVTRQPTREFHLAHPATANAQEHINAGHKEQEEYFNTPMPFTLPEAEQALDWRNQELNNTIRQRDEVQTQLRENEKWASDIRRGIRGPRSKKFLGELRGVNHRLWQTGQALEWRCQNATTRRDETAQNLEKIRHAIEHNKEAYLNSIKSVERQRFPKDHAIFNEERGRAEAARQEEKRFTALARQEQEAYSNASMPATMDEARAAADSGVRHFENCVRERNASKALCDEKQSRLETTKTMLAEEWNPIVEYDLELLEEEVAALRRTVEIQDQRAANAYARAAEVRRQKLLGLHSKADFDTSHALASEALEQFIQRQANNPDDASVPTQADEEQSLPSPPMLNSSQVDSGNKPEGEVAPVSKPRNPALTQLATLSSEIAAKAALRAERQANRENEVSNASVAAEHESSPSTSDTTPVPENHTTISTTLGASALAVAAPSTLTTSGAVTGVSVNLGELASAAARGLTGAASTILSAPAIGVGALLYSSKAGEGSDKVPGRENGVPAALLAKRHNDSNATNYSGQGREASSIRETGRDTERYSSRGDIDKHAASSQANREYIAVVAQADTAFETTRHDSQPQAKHPHPVQLAKPAIKPKPRFNAKIPEHSLNIPIFPRTLSGPDCQKIASANQQLQQKSANAWENYLEVVDNGIKPPLAPKPKFNRAKIDAHRLQVSKLAEANVENNSLVIMAPHSPVAGTNNGDATTEEHESSAFALNRKLNVLGEAIDKATEYLSGRACSLGSSEKTDGPNVAKNLTDAEKAELGGAGSSTGTPPPPPSEKDPKQLNEKLVKNLNQKQESAIKKIDNTIKNALKDHDITGTLKDMNGIPVPKRNGGYWDHMQEMQNTLRGLRNNAETLKNVNNPEAQAAYGRAVDAINEIESVFKGNGI